MCTVGVKVLTSHEIRKTADILKAARMVLVKFSTIFSSGVPRNFVRGIQQIQLRTEDRENGNLGAVAP